MESGPSKTASGIASGRALACREPRYASILPPGAAASFATVARAAAPRWAWRDRVRTWFPVRRALMAWTGLTTPGMTVHLLTRKRFLDDEVRRAVADGAEQVVVLAAGFDTLGARMLADHPGLACFDVDHPATQRARTDLRVAIGDEAPSPHPIAVDLGTDALGPALLAHPAWRPDARSVWVAEGLTMYLEQRHVDALLRAFATHAGPGSRFLFTFIDAEPGPIPVTGRFDAYTRWRLRRMREPLRWSLPRTRLDAFLAERGLRCVACPEPRELVERYLMHLPETERHHQLRERFTILEPAAARAAGPD